MLRGLSVHGHSCFSQARPGREQEGPLGTGNIPLLSWLLAAQVLLVCEIHQAVYFLYVYVNKSTNKIKNKTPRASMLVLFLR